MIIICKIMNFLKGQTTLEIALAISLAVILVVASISTWNWFNKTMVERFQYYNASRLAAIQDIRNSQFGMKDSYSRPNLGIFSLDTSINNAPLAVPLELINNGTDYQACSDNLTIQLAIANETHFEIQELDQLIINITNETFILKNELGNIEAVESFGYAPWNSDDLFMLWIYGQDNSGDFFNNTLSQLASDTTQKIYDLGLQYHTVAFWTYWPGGSTVDIWNEYFTPGINKETQGANLAQQRNQQQAYVDNLEEQMWQDFYDCIGQTQSVDECHEQCVSYQELGNSLYEQALVAFGGGDMEQYQLLSNQSQEAYADYDECYHNCQMLIPGFAECYNNYYEPALQAFLLNLTEEYLELMEQYQNCTENL